MNLGIGKLTVRRKHWETARSSQNLKAKRLSLEINSGNYLKTHSSSEKPKPKETLTLTDFQRNLVTLKHSVKLKN